jgi:P27 family predicted phage terminase small subunit
MPTRLKSSQRKDLHHTARRDRQPKPAVFGRLLTVPRPPKHLSQRAATEWKRVAPALVAIGTLTGADLRALELLAETLATEAEARAILATEGLTAQTADGGSKSHPAVRIMETARGQAVRLLADFGLTPKGRQSVDIVPLPSAKLPAGSYPPGSLDAFLAEGTEIAEERWADQARRKPPGKKRV